MSNKLLPIFAVFLSVLAISLSGFALYRVHAPHYCEFEVVSGQPDPVSFDPETDGSSP